MQVAAGSVLLAILLALVVHAPPVRRVALRRAIAILADRFDISLRADGLRYNLFALSATLTGVEVASTRTVESPLLTADRVDIAIPTAAIFGSFALDRVVLQNARVAIEIDEDGRSNLPEGGGDAGEPQPLDIGRLQIDRLAVSVMDSARDVFLDLPGLAIDVGKSDGSVRLLQPGRAAIGETRLTLDTLGGDVEFDGRALALGGFDIATPDARVEVDGTLALLVEEPGADLRFTAGGDLARLARLVPEPPPIAGLVELEGTLTGPFIAPMARLRARSDALRWDRFELAGVAAAADADDRGIRVTQFDARLADGRITGSGALATASGLVDLSVSWSDVSVDVLSRALGSDALRIAATTNGSATLRGAGSNPVDWTIDARARLTPERRRAGQLAVAGDAELRTAEGRWSLDADANVERIPLRAAVGGRLNGQTLAASTLSGTITAREADVPAVLRSLRDAGLITAAADTVAAGRAEATAQLAGTLSAPRVHLMASGRDLAAGGVSDVALDLTADGTVRDMTVDARVRQSAGNDVAITGRVQPEGGAADLRVTGTLGDWRALQPDLAAGGRATLDLRVQGPFEALKAAGTLTVADAAYDDVRLGELLAEIQADATAVRLDVRAPELQAQGTGTLALTGARQAAVQIQVAGADLERLTRDVALPVPISGRVSLDARGEGSLDDWRRGTAEAVVTELDARVGELPVSLAAPARLAYSGDTIDVASLEGTLGQTHLSVAGRLPVSDAAPAVAAADALRALLVGDIEHLIDSARAMGLTTPPDLAARGPVAVVARVTGTAERPAIAADLEIGASEIAYGGVPPVRVEAVRASLVDGVIERFTAAAEWQQSRVSAEGRIPLRVFRDHLPAAIVDALPAAAGAAALNLRAESITPAVLAPFVDPGVADQIAGTIDASARLEADGADIASVRGDVRLDRLDVRVAGLPVSQRTPTRIELAGGVARVAAWEWVGQGATLNVQGEIGLTTQQAALLAAGVVDLRMLSPFLRAAGMAVSGTLAPRIAVTGSLTDPQVDGEAAITGAEIRLAEPRLVATGVNVFAVLSPDRARITNLTGIVNGGTLNGTGDARYGPGVQPSARIAGTITGLGLEFPEGLRSELNADLALAVAQDGEAASGSLTGTVTVVRSAYREPLAVAAGLLTALRTEQAVAAQADPDAFLSRLALDVRLLTDSDVIVDNNLARLQLGGDLRLIGTAASPALSGRAVLREGGQLFLGRNVYTIREGSTIDFADPVTIVPELNVLATTRAGGHEIDLTLAGTPETLEFVTSSPTLTDEADRVAVLLTGRTFENVQGAEGDIVREQLVSYLSGDALALATRVVGLDTIRLGGPDVSTLRRDPAAVAAEADPTSRLTFGKLIGNNVELTYSQSLREGDAQTWIVDVRPIPQVNLRVVSDDDNLRAYEFRHDVSIGGSRIDRPAGAARETPSERVTAVTIAGDGAVAEEALRGSLRLEQGDTFDFGAWQADRDRLETRLHDEGRLEARVTTEREPRDGGVAIAYDVAAGPRTTLSVTGYSLARGDRQAIERAWSQSIFDDSLREEAEGIARAALARDGYLEPQVSSSLTTGDPRTLTIAIDPGTRARQRRVSIAVVENAALQGELEEWIEARGLDVAWTAPDEVGDAVEDEVRLRGYIAAQVRTEMPRAEPGVAVLPVIVDAGPLFRIGDVTFAGASRIDAARLRDDAALAAGDPYIGADLEAARQRVDARYNTEGFLSARVTAQPLVDQQAGRVAVVFTIDEGPQQILREVAVRGNRGIDLDVITRALDLTVGEPVAADTWLRARARLFDTGLFRRVDVVAEPLEADADGRQQPTRLAVNVEEWPALRVRYGVQVSERRPEESLEGRDLVPGLSGDVTRRTLFGRAISLGAAGELQRRERLARVFLSAPTFLAWPVESLFSAERSHRDFAADDFVTDLSSLAWEQRVRLGRTWQFGYSYRFDRDHTFDTRVSDDPTDPVFDIAVNVARLTGSAVYDTRDDPTESTRGWLVSTNLETAPTSLGSDVSFLRFLNQAYYFRQAGPLVLASAGRFGVVTPRAGQVLLPTELFRGGGPRTLRGVAEDELGPRDFFGPTGGRAIVLMNQEVRFPLYRWVRGVGFLDVGNVFPEPRDIAFGQMVTSLGAGLRVATPFALLRIDYGRAWTNTGEMRRAEWTFGIGHTF